MIIIATIGLSGTPENAIRKIILAGADVLRFNFSYRDVRENRNLIAAAQQIIEELNSSAQIMIDFPLNKIRLGDFEEKIFKVKEGQEVIFKCAPFSPNCNQFIPVDTQKLAHKVYVDQMITIGDGEISIQIIEIINNDTVKAKVLNKGAIKYMKTFNCHYEMSEQEILETYDYILEKVRNIRPHKIAISFIDFEINEKIKKMIERKYIQSKVVLKIEHGFNETDLQRICQDSFYNAILVDRGELGVNEPYEKLPYYQDIITKTAKANRRPVIVSTQILKSTVRNFIPARSDIMDLSNIVRSGANGIMFCRETGATMRPAYTLSVARKIIFEASKQRKI